MMVVFRSNSGQVGNQVTLIFLTGNPRKPHSVSRYVLPRIFQVHPEMFVGPHNTRVLDGLAVTESSCAGLPAHNSSQRRSSRALAVALNHT